MSIEIREINKSFGQNHVLRDVTLQIETGELVALLGPSGCGKTTLLRIVAGLELADSGSILFHGADTTRKGPRDRQVGFVFQHYALFQHMTVFENVAFGLRVRPRDTRPAKDEIRRRVLELLALVHLDGMAGRYPSQLSGGQRQRVALARALAVEPKVLLLDEPFGALDANVRRELRRWLRRLHDEIHITGVFVTHDQEEALEVADRVVVMNKGVVEQYGTPEEVYHRPANPFVYNFLGSVNVFHGRVEGGKAYIGETELDLAGLTHADTETATFCFRPHLLDIDYSPNGAGFFRAQVVRVNAAGPVVKVELTSEWGDPVEAEISQERQAALGLARGAQVYVSPRDRKVYVDDYVI